MVWNNRWGALALALALVAAAAGCSNGLSPAAPGTSQTGDAAAALVERFHMGDGLESLALEAAHHTVTYGGLVQKHGALGADILVKREIDKSLPVYQPQWNGNLATVYARHFSPAELRSLANDGPRSPYASKFASAHDAVGAEMRAASTGLLEQLVTEALTRAVQSP